MKKFTRFMRWLYRPYQLVLRRQADLAEQHTIRFTYAQVSLGLLVLFVVLLALSIGLVRSALAQWLHPTYQAERNQQQLVQLSSHIQTLEHQLVYQKRFIQQLQQVIAGETSTTNLGPIPPAITITPPKPIQKISQPRSSAVATTHTPQPTSLLPKKKLDAGLFFPPVEGVQTAEFDPAIAHYGIDIVARDNEPIKNIANGTVILASWTVETGWVIAIQHTTGLISIYKHNATLFKQVGDYVKQGEVIAIIGASGELSTGPHLHLELWQDGMPLNGADFIKLRED